MTTSTTERRRTTASLVAAVVAVTTLVCVVVGTLAAPAPTDAPVPTTPGGGDVVRPADVALTGAERSLRDSLQTTVGFDPSLCTSFAPDQPIRGRTASLECPVQGLTEGGAVVFHGFTDEAAREDHLARRVPADGTGACAQGQDSTTRWLDADDGSDRGALICATVPEGGASHFTIVWSDDRTNRVAVIEDPSWSTAWTWWNDHTSAVFT